MDRKLRACRMPCPVCNAETIERAAERAITMAKRARRLPDYAPVVDPAIQAVSRLR